MTLKEYLEKNYKPYYTGNKSINLEWEYKTSEEARKRGYNGIIIKNNGSEFDLLIEYVKSKNAYKVIVR